MGLTLYGIDASPPVRAVKLVLAALELDYEYVNVNLLEGDHIKDEYKKKNPQHTVPLLEDGDCTIWDSHAIAAYLVTVYGKDDSLYPKEPKKRAIVDQRLHFDSGILFPKVRGITEPILFFNTGSVNQQILDTIPKAYEFMEAFLENGNYLAGDHLTIADLSVMSSMTCLNFYKKIDAKEYPRITAWFKRLEALPYYHEASAVGLDLFTLFVTSKLKTAS